MAAPTRYRVRFDWKRHKSVSVVDASNPVQAQQPQSPPSPTTGQAPQQRTKSKTGCQECKERRVKCDETYPVCQRCQRRGSVCLSIPRMDKWQIEMPWLNNHGPYNNPLYGVANANQRYLQLWLERSSQMMVIDQGNNPMSYPVIEHLMKAPSLVHALQSVSAGFEEHFDDRHLALCLEERHRALVAVREELNCGSGSGYKNATRKRPLPSTYLSVFMLGMTSPWIDGNYSAFGKEHLFGARAIVDCIVEDALEDKAGGGGTDDPWLQFIVGSYVYWDMSCSFLADPDEMQPMNTALMHRYLQATRHAFHPMCGLSVELFHLMADVGRHCRRVAEGRRDRRDKILEISLETELLGCLADDVATTARDNHRLFSESHEGFRKAGLIMLYRSCGRPSTDGNDELSADRTSTTATAKIADVDQTIRALALEIVKHLSRIPLSSPIMNIQGIPLITAGSELTKADVKQRREVKTRLQSMYSRNRSPPHLWACELLDNLWTLRDESAGCKMSWLDLMLLKGWRFSLT